MGVWSEVGAFNGRKVVGRPPSPLTNSGIWTVLKKQQVDVYAIRLQVSAGAVDELIKADEVHDASDDGEEGSRSAANCAQRCSVKERNTRQDIGQLHLWR
jgi:hypothetical protein